MNIFLILWKSISRVNVSHSTVLYIIQEIFFWKALNALKSRKNIGKDFDVSYKVKI